MQKRFVWLAGLLAVSCRPAPESATPAAEAPAAIDYDAATRTFTCRDPRTTEPAWLSNGLVGVRIDRAGDITVAFRIDKYETTGEERIIPQPAPPPMTVDGKPIDPAVATDYTQTLDLSTGILSTRFTANGLHVEREIAIPEGGFAPQTYATVSADHEFQAGPDRRTRNLTVGSPLKAPRQISRQIEIDGPATDQMAVDSMLFNLRQSIHPTGKMSVSPMALSSDHYNGHVFWDADIWVFPALALLDPVRAAVIPRYRIRMLPAALKNGYAWRRAKELPVNEATAKYPWESSVSGRETVPGPSRFQDHITGSVAFSVGMANRLGLIDNADWNRLRAPAAEFFRARSVVTKRGREIHNTMSPDENHTGDNDLYTNLLAEWLSNGGGFNRTPTYYLPRDKTSFLTYDRDALRGYKQAAAVLAIYPLQYPAAEAEARAMMDRFADKVTKNGPAMTESIHAVIEARFGDADAAYAHWRKGVEPFTVPPFALFSEKRSRPYTNFVTGEGGAIQSILYGFAGLRLDDRPLPNAAWRLHLRSGYWLSARPHLPTAWKSVRIRSLQVDGKSYDLTFRADGQVVVNG